MDLVKLYKQEERRAFKAKLVMNGLAQRWEKTARKLVLNGYESKTINLNGVLYKYHNCTLEFSPFTWGVDLCVYLTDVSEAPERRARVLRLERQFIEGDFMDETLLDEEDNEDKDEPTPESSEPTCFLMYQFNIPIAQIIAGKLALDFITPAY